MLRDAILEHVNNPNYQPVKPAVIAKQLGLLGDAAHDVTKTIKSLVKEKQLAYGPSHLVYSAGKSPSQRDAAAKAEKKAAARAAFQAALKPAAEDKDNTTTNQGNNITKERIKKEKPSKAAKGDRPLQSSKHFTGTFRRAAAGFGFVRPEGTLGRGRPRCRRLHPDG